MRKKGAQKMSANIRIITPFYRKMRRIGQRCILYYASVLDVLIKSIEQALSAAYQICYNKANKIFFIGDE